MRFVKVLILLLIFIVGLVFFVQNSAALGTNLQLKFDLYYYGLSWQGQAIPFYFVVLAAFALGMLFATLMLFIDRIRLGCSLIGHKRAVRTLEREVERLRVERAKEAKPLPPAPEIRETAKETVKETVTDGENQGA
ncbi:MAG: LapA family protein, partial [Desulfovibrio sp.]|nr:LapA family protein [Desulfovibrio sp.]